MKERKKENKTEMYAASMGKRPFACVMEKINDAKCKTSHPIDDHFRMIFEKWFRFQFNYPIQLSCDIAMHPAIQRMP